MGKNLLGAIITRHDDKAVIGIKDVINGRIGKVSTGLGM